ncbi:hypothetical protein QKU58_gp110 [Pyramimonas orientalis virus]|uniref:Uncharacterized protein n=1 Tax=Pyramimonas orientalis virus 01B TaxID=3134525 RepID=A0A7M3UNG6_9VIRU|nr:hypothetical protein QKU58_gp110 [Pyramimonas orientalis virus]QOI90221.1 hypothetical protein HWQ62_00084 [Pyramimonas orientalis virus]
MDLSLDTLKELVFDFNSDCLLDLYDTVKEESTSKGIFLMNRDSTDFVQIILDNVTFYKIQDDDDDLLSE